MLLCYSISLESVSATVLFYQMPGVSECYCVVLTNSLESVCATVLF